MAVHAGRQNGECNEEIGHKRTETPIMARCGDCRARRNRCKWQLSPASETALKRRTRPSWSERIPARTAHTNMSCFRHRAGVIAAMTLSIRKAIIVAAVYILLFGRTVQVRSQRPPNHASLQTGNIPTRKEEGVCCLSN